MMDEKVNPSKGAIPRMRERQEFTTLKCAANSSLYTQEAFAEKIGRSVNFLAQVEGTGTVRGVSLETLFRIAECLNISAAKLLEDD